MIVGVVGCVEALAQEGNELEELVGLRIKIWQEIPTNWNTLRGSNGNEQIEGIFWQIKGDWLILKVWIEQPGLKWIGGWVWCYIPTIRKIEILDRDYKPEEE